MNYLIKIGYFFMNFWVYEKYELVRPRIPIYTLLQGEEDIEQIDDKQALLLVKKLKKYSIEREPSLFNDILNLEDKLIKIEFEKLKNQKQARITDYFHK